MQLDEAVELLEKYCAELEPELLNIPAARRDLRTCARAGHLLDFIRTTLAAKVDDAAELAQVTGTSMGKAKETVATGKVLNSSPVLNSAMQHGEVSLDQAAQIAKAEEAAPGAAEDLLKVAKKENFNVLREQARRKKLEAEQHRDLGERQRAARTARARVDDLGMAEICLRLQPHIGVPLMNRAETEARRLYKAAKKNGNQEAFECHLADAYSKMLAGGGKPSTTRPEVVYLVSWEVAQRGYREVRKGEVCKIPARGPVDPREVKEIAERAFLNAVVSDGKDLRHFKRFGKHVTKELAIALELGDAPGFDGPRCVDCGSRFRLERDHVEPRNARGPTSKPNLKWRCDPCHEVKTERDRSAGKLKRKPKPEQMGKLKPKPDRKPRGP